MLANTKIDLLQDLDAINNNFMLGMAAAYLLNHPDAKMMLRDVHLAFIPQGAPRERENASIEIPIEVVIGALEQPEIRESLITSFRNQVFRTTLSETLEAIKEYCVNTRQSKVLLDADWYNFTRLIRNALTHDGILRFDKKARPPVEFFRWRLEASDEGKHLSALGIPTTSAVPVLQRARQFVESALD